MKGRLFLAAAIFGFVETLLWPAFGLGYALFVLKLITYRRQSQVSETVLASMVTRWMQHRLGVRPDPACDALMRVMPNVPPVALYLSSASLLIAHKLSGYVPPTFRYPYEGVPPMSDQSAARTTFYDEALEQHLGNLDQLVILGAGFDTRTYRLSPDVQAAVSRWTRRERKSSSATCCAKRASMRGV